MYEPSQIALLHLLDTLKKRPVLQFSDPEVFCCANKPNEKMCIENISCPTAIKISNLVFVLGHVILTENNEKTDKNSSARGTENGYSCSVLEAALVLIDI